MLTIEEQTAIVQLAEKMAQARVIAAQSAGRWGDSVDEYLSKHSNRGKRGRPAYLQIREDLIDTLKEVG
jgi:hypothetical protein